MALPSEASAEAVAEAGVEAADGDSVEPDLPSDAPRLKVSETPVESEAEAVPAAADEPVEADGSSDVETATGSSETSSAAPEPSVAASTAPPPASAAPAQAPAEKPANAGQRKRCAISILR